MKQNIAEFEYLALIVNYNEFLDKTILKKEYFENAKYWNDILRNACFSYISPIDYIISLFDIIWNKGCKRAVFNNRKTFIAS